MISALTHELGRGWQAEQNLRRQYLFLASVFLCESSMVALNSRRWEVHRVLEMLTWAAVGMKDSWSSGNRRGMGRGWWEGWGSLMKL